MNNINNDFEEIENMIKDLNKGLHNLKKKIKIIEKNVNKQNKQNNKKKRKPSGFAQPQTLSKELCLFLNIDENSKMSRTNVTKILIKYIKDNNLYKSNNILLDDKLKYLFSENENITFFTIQKFMNKHYINV